MSPPLDPCLNENDPIYNYLIAIFPNYNWKFVKNQHYVPVFYQKQFSSCKDSKGKDLIRHCNGEEPRDIIIRDFCKLDYTYGVDCHFETAYSLSENRVCGLIRNICKNPTNNHFRTKSSRESLLEFLASLDNRSIRTITQQRQFISSIEDNLCESLGITDYKLNTHLSDKANLFVSLDYSWIDETCYFEYCIIRNNSDLPLITSDCPLCIFNLKYLKMDSIPQYDKATEGALWFIPLSPKIGFLMYDKRHYSIDSDKKIIDINKDETDELNKLVSYNAFEELLYNSTNLDNYVKELTMNLPEKLSDSRCKDTFGRGFYMKASVNLDFININNQPIQVENVPKRHKQYSNMMCTAI